MNKNVTSGNSDALREAREHEPNNEKEESMHAPLQPADILDQALHKGRSSTDDSVPISLVHLVWLHSTRVKLFPGHLHYSEACEPVIAVH